MQPDPDQPAKPLSREIAQALSALVKSWDVARDARRVALGKPLPGSLQHRQEKRQPKRRSPAQASGILGPAGGDVAHQGDDQGSDQGESSVPATPHTSG